MHLMKEELQEWLENFIFPLAGKKCLHSVFLLPRLRLSLGQERGNGVGKDESYIAFHAQ